MILMNDWFIHQVMDAHGRLLCIILKKGLRVAKGIDHLTVVCLIAWPLNDSAADVALVLIETSLLFLCKVLVISTRTASLI